MSNTIPRLSNFELDNAPEAKLQKIYEEEEVDNIIFEIKEELIERVLAEIESRYFQKQVYAFVADCAIDALKKAVEMNFYFHNPPFSSVLEHPSWAEDKPGPTCKPDSWAAYNVPISYKESPNNEASGSRIKTEKKLKEQFKYKESLRAIDEAQDLNRNSDLILYELYDGVDKDFYKALSVSSDEKVTSQFVSTTNTSFRSTVPEDKREQINSEYLPSVFSRMAIGDSLQEPCVSASMAEGPPITSTQKISSDTPKIQNLSPTSHGQEKKGKQQVFPPSNVLPPIRTETRIKPAESPSDDFVLKKNMHAESDFNLI